MPEDTRIGPKGLMAFVGRWSLDRNVTHFDGALGKMSGHLQIDTAGADRAIYTEDGVLTLGTGEPLRATRRYLWRAAPSAIDVSFEDGRPFHRIDLSGPRPATVHLCDPDRYAVAYDFANWPVWTARWEVEGPNKGYVMTTTYAPMR